MIETEPIVSVVIPVYRVEQFLRESVESVLAQTFREFEIILVDDGSPDTCPQICDAYAAAYPCSGSLPRVKVVHKANAGLGMARNTGMDAACGKYILFLDSDDTLRADTLERLLRVTAAHPDLCAVHGSICRFVQSGKYSADITSNECLIIDTSQGLRRAALCSFASFPGDEPYTLEGSTCGTLFDLAFLRKHNVRFQSERQYISEDYIFNFNVARYADGIAQVPDTLYRYRINPNSLTQSPKADVMTRITYYCEKIEEMMSEAGFDKADAAKYAFGYAASKLRTQYKYMFRARGKMHDKLRRAREWRGEPYFQRMIREFDPAAMSLLHRVNYSLFVHSRFRVLYMLICCQQLLRRLAGHIGD